jgi:hypothetical protein
MPDLDASPIRVAQGIVGFADLAVDDRVEPVLESDFSMPSMPASNPWSSIRQG